VARQSACENIIEARGHYVWDVYQQAEAGDSGEGGGHGGASELDPAEVSDEHDGDHLDDVLQEASGDKRAELTGILIAGEHQKTHARTQLDTSVLVL
jgi:hypothetical protein